MGRYSRSHSRSRSRGRRGDSRDNNYDTDQDGYRVHVADLGVNCSQKELEHTFGKFGGFNELWLARNPPCFAFVVYKHRGDAEVAIREMDGRVVCGSRVKVSWARPRTRGRNAASGQFDPNLRCYQCGERGHFSRDCGRQSSRRRDNDRGRYDDDRRRRRRRSRSRSRSRSRRHSYRGRRDSYSRSRSRSPRVRRNRDRSYDRDNYSKPMNGDAATVTNGDQVARSRSRSPRSYRERRHSRSRSPRSPREQQVKSVESHQVEVVDDDAPLLNDPDMDNMKVVDVISNGNGEHSPSSCDNNQEMTEKTQLHDENGEEDPYEQTTKSDNDENNDGGGERDDDDDDDDDDNNDIGIQQVDELAVEASLEHVLGTEAELNDED